MALLTLTDTIHAGLVNMGFAVAVVNGTPMLFATGAQQDADGRPCLMAIRRDGQVVWRDEFPEEPGSIAMGAEPHVVRLDGGTLAVAHFVAHRESGAGGVLRLLDASNGEEIWRASSGSFYGGNRDVHCADVDRDGELELIVGYADRLACYRAIDGRPKRAKMDRIAICWGRSAVADLDGDGLPEIVLGTEYANPDGTSSILALRGDGSPVWEQKGIEGDCGSTPTYVGDLDGDGRVEVLKTEIDLEGRGPAHMARLWCLTAEGDVKWRLDFGCGDIALADLDGDGFQEAVGITSGRDGGNVPPAVRCADLRTGTMKWEMPLGRHWLTGWPAVVRVPEGASRVVLLHGNPSDYGRRSGDEAWGELLLIGNGRIEDRKTYSDWPVAAKVFDWNADGEDEVLVSCGDGNVYVYRLETE